MKVLQHITHAVSISRSCHTAILTIILLLPFVTSIYADVLALAAAPVSAKYIGISGDTVRLRISIGSPTPQSMILEQYLPPGAQLVDSSPAARQVRNSGVVKWLFKKVSPGNIDVSMRVSPPGAARKVGGTLLFRMPGGGKMQELRISH